MNAAVVVSQPMAAALLEFLAHGIRYVFPIQPGGLTRGVATGFAAPGLQMLMSESDEHMAVWPWAGGDWNDMFCLQERPYTGIQFAGISEFSDLGTKVSQYVSAVIAGKMTVDEALTKGQADAEKVSAKRKQG